MMIKTASRAGHIYLATALLFIVTAVIGFVPTSLALISQMSSGQESTVPFVIHFHAAALTLWLLMLLVQSSLIFLDKPQLHKKLGLISLFLAPCVLLSLFGIEKLSFDRIAAAAASSDQVDAVLQGIPSSLLIHGASYLFFPAFYIWAILSRQRDSETHKRMMILATLVLMIPALGRMLSVSRIIPDFGLSIIDARHFYMLLLIVPALIYDTLKLGRPHRAYIYGLTLVGVWIVAAHFLWGATWWAEITTSLFGPG